MGYQIASVGLVLGRALNQAFRPLFIQTLKDVEHARNGGDEPAADMALRALAQSGLVLVAAIACVLLCVTAVAREALLVLTGLGHGQHPPLARAIEFMLSKQDEEGRWLLEYSPAKTWVRFEQRGQPSKWVTLNALRVLKSLASPTHFGL